MKKKEKTGISPRLCVMETIDCFNFFHYGSGLLPIERSILLAMLGIALKKVPRDAIGDFTHESPSVRHELLLTTILSDTSLCIVISLDGVKYLCSLIRSGKEIGCTSLNLIEKLPSFLNGYGRINSDNIRK